MLLFYYSLVSHLSFQVNLSQSQLHSNPSNPNNGQPLGNSSGDDGNQGNVVRLRGLPWAATAAEITGLLGDASIKNGEQGIHFTFGPDGRASGEAFVEVCSAEDVSKALGHNREHLGGRYIEIFKAYQAQLDWECRVTERVSGEGGVVRLRGLPYGCSDEDVRDFFSGLGWARHRVYICLYVTVCMFMRSCNCMYVISWPILVLFLGMLAITCCEPCIGCQCWLMQSTCV